jgi:thiamine biosynthesis protein ThiS
MKLKINGQQREFTEAVPAALTDLLRILNIDSATVVAELDGQIVPRAEFGTTSLKDGASVELVRFVGGG